MEWSENKKERLLWIRLGLILPSIVLMTYIYKLVVTRSMFWVPEFFVLVALGTVAFLLIIKGLLQTKSERT
jgi:ATP/ADP translocase